MCMRVPKFFAAYSSEAFMIQPDCNLVETSSFLTQIKNCFVKKLLIFGIRRGPKPSGANGQLKSEEKPKA